MNNVVLVHGHSCKNPEEYYKGLREKLSSHYRTVIFPYNFRDSVQNIAYSVDKFLAENNMHQCNFVGHSLGNVVIRYFLGSRNYECDRFVAIFPPFNGSTLISMLGPIWMQEKVMGYATTQLQDLNIKLLLPPETELGIITGDKKLAKSWKYKIQRSLLQPFLGFSNNDGLLKITETLPADLKYEHYLIHENHMDSPDSPEMVQQVLSFLGNGKFLK